MIKLNKREFPLCAKLIPSFNIGPLEDYYYILQKKLNSGIKQKTSHLIYEREDISKNFPIQSGGYEYLPITLSKNTSIDSCFKDKNKLEKSRILLNEEIQNSPFDERNYTDWPIDTPKSFLKEMSKIKGIISRTRFTVLKSCQKINPHIDHPLWISCRIHIPIQTNSEVFFNFFVNNRKYSYHLPADGSAYFLNTAYMHSVENNGNSDRVHLILNLNTAEDITFLREKKNEYSNFL
jgi:hypothetical protein